MSETRIFVLVAIICLTIGGTFQLCSMREFKELLPGEYWKKISNNMKTAGTFYILATCGFLLAYSAYDLAMVRYRIDTSLQCDTSIVMVTITFALAMWSYRKAYLAHEQAQRQNYREIKDLSLLK